MNRRAILTGVAACLLFGCTSILPNAGDLSPRLALDPGAPVDEPMTPLATSLVVSDPAAEAVYNTFNVAVATAPFQFEYLENAEWTDRVPVMFRIFMERRFENVEAFQAVGDRTNLPLAAYDLKTDIRAFHLDRTSEPAAAEVAFGARLVDRRGQTLGTRVFRQRVNVSGPGRVAAVEALNQAAVTAVDDTILWARTLIIEARSSEAP